MDKTISNQTISTGNTVGEYRLLEKIGQGGFGEVWKGEHQFLKGHFVAIKILKADFSSEVLAREARVQFELQKKLEEKNLEKSILRLLGCDPHGDPPYLITEYIEPDAKGSTSLRDYIQHYQKDQKGLQPELALDFFWQLVAPLSIAHSAGMVHGDLKPENILIQNGNRVKLADFGLAKAKPLEGDNLSRSLKISREQGSIFGTFAYMSPEQKRGESSDSASDMYSLGIILYEMVVGSPPQGGEVPSQIVSDLPPEIDVLFRKCYNHLDFRVHQAGELEELREEECMEEQVEDGVDQAISTFVELEIIKDSPEPLPANNYGKPAGFLRRLFAFGVDCITLILAFASLLPLFYAGKDVFSCLFFFFVFSSGYWIFSTCILGGTLGKLSLGLKVVDHQGKKLTLGASFSRWMGYFFSFFFFGFGFYMVLFHPEKRGLHDFFGSSFVVYDD